jgi:VanZ family protein
VTAIRPLRYPRFWLALWLLAIAVVVAASLLPPLPLTPKIDGGDKLMHLLGYGLLMASAVQIFQRAGLLLSVALGLAALGLLMEFGQGGLTSTRQFEWADAAANAIGVLLGGAMAFTPAARLLQRWFPAVRTEPDPGAMV